MLSGRIARAKTEDPNHDPAGRGPGIQIYHYKDPGSLLLKHIFVFVFVFAFVYYHYKDTSSLPVKDIFV